MTQDGPTTAKQSGGGTVVLIILSLAMFVYVIDTTLMNVSISALVEDLDTTVGAVQAAITLYMLTMAAFMLTGGKLGDIWGSKRAFRIGLVIYGVGTTITALAPSIVFIFIGWSILEGLGSALIVPAINTLVRANYRGTKRASAYGVLFGVAAAGAAFGPLVGGWITTEYTWRLAFGLEALIVFGVLLSSGLLTDSPRVEPKPRLDVIGVLLSVFGLGLLVLGILQMASWGWDDPRVLSMIAGGATVIGVFVWWIRRQTERGEPALVSPALFRHRSISAGLPVLATQTFAQAGLLFLIPLYAQSFLGLDAFETGLTILPLSIAVLLTSIVSPGLGKKIYPRYIIQAGLVVLFAGGVILALALDDATAGGDLALGLAVVGVGIGLVVGQLPNLILSGVDSEEASEASGLQGTAQNLGMALGTAVVGTVILSVSIASIGSQVDDSTILTPEIKAEVTEALEEDVNTAGTEDLELALEAASPEVQAEAEQIFIDGSINGFQAAIFAGAIVALLGALLTFRLPKVKLKGDVLEQAVRSPGIPKVQLEMKDL
ncbi:MAG: MFS transporter [Chloroflexi bacterium]|nr:MFS transporter [Chloroflexota bacterium]